MANPSHRRTFIGIGQIAALALILPGCRSAPPQLVTIGPGWAQNSINSVIIRNQSVTTHGQSQYTAYYDPDGHVVLAKRELGSRQWQIHTTDYTGNLKDAHNAISIAVDGDGFLHVSWDHHNHPLRYARSREPGSLELTDKLTMTGEHEDRVCYPEFYNLDDGGLVFMYRDGASGNGDTLLNRYDPKTQKWSVVQHPLIAGQGQRNAYPNQIAIDHDGAWHLSWNWREHGGVQTNHDICYAKSLDEGQTWVKSTGEAYTLPITEATAEIAWAIPQNSELINHTTTVADSRGRPIIATYWRPPGTDIPQYFAIWHDGERWQCTQVGDRRTPFRLSGGGTKRIPISRPKLAVDSKNRVYMIFRDVDRGDRVSVAICDDLCHGVWRFVDLTCGTVGMWEPSYDTLLWQRDEVLHIFVQRVGQGDGEKLEAIPPQPAAILEWEP